MAKETSDRLILVPVDFSKHSECALLYAADLSRYLDSPLLILHVVHDPGEMPGYYGAAIKKKQLARIEDAAAVMLDEFLQRIAAANPGFKKLKRVESKLVKGLPVTRILEVADKKNAAMIVLGNKGLTGVKHILMGSVSEQVVRLAKVPVTIVKTCI